MDIRQLFAFAILLVCLTPPIASQDRPCNFDAVIFGNSVRLRQEPRIDSSILGLLNTGDEIHIARETVPETQINDMKDHWYFVNIQNKSGWVFGGFVRFNYEKQGDVFVSHYYSIDSSDLTMTYFRTGIPEMHSHTLHMKNGNAPAYFPSLSPNFRWVALDSGTDGIGALEFYDLTTDQLVYSARYDRAILSKQAVWEEDCFSFHAIKSVSNGCFHWIEKKFCAGSITITGRSGIGLYHSLGPQQDPSCSEK